MNNVLILDCGVRITDLEVMRKDVADFLRAVDESEIDASLIHAIEVGVFCLERARMGQDTEFVRRQVESLMSRVENAVEKIPGDTKKALVEKIGTENGQVLAPIKEMIDSASRLTADKVKEIRTLLTQEIDPEKETTTLGKALRTLRNLLDPKRSDSVQSTLENALNCISSKDGALATAVKTVVETAVKPLADELDKLAKEMRGQEAAAEAIEQTTLKGTPYEEEVTQILHEWAQAVGAEVHHVGGDKQPGDVIVTLRSDGVIADTMSIVVESRDRGSRAMGRKAISNEMAIKVGQREADAGVYVSRTQEGLSLREIGDWAEGCCDKGPWVACTHQHLITAIRFLIVQHRLTALRGSAPEVDSAGIEQQVKTIRSAIGRIKTIKTKLTELGTCSEAVNNQADYLRDEIKEALCAIEDSLRSGQGKQPPKVQLVTTKQAVAAT